MKEKIFCLALGVLLFALCLSVQAQPQVKVPKIGWLGTRPFTGKVTVGNEVTRGNEITRRMLRELGYVEGKNIAFEFRSADNKLDGSPPWLMSWSVSKWTCSSCLRRLLP